MTAWTADDLATFGDADEIDLSSRRPDGSARPFITIWSVRVGDAVYVRSAYGPDNGWYRRAKASGLGWVRAGAEEREVAFEDASGEARAPLDAAYHVKYDRYGSALVATVVSDDAARSTLRISPR